MDRLESAYQEYHYLLASWRHTRGQAFQLAATWKAQLPRTRTRRTSENSVHAKFAEFLFHALG